MNGIFSWIKITDTIRTFHPSIIIFQDMTAQVPFALTPTLVNNDIIDYTTAEGAKLCCATIKVLPGDPFNCKPHGIKVLLETTEDHAATCG